MNQRDEWPPHVAPLRRGERKQIDAVKRHPVCAVGERGIHKTHEGSRGQAFAGTRLANKRKASPARESKVDPVNKVNIVLTVSVQSEP